MEKIKLKIGEMNCTKCANRLQGVLNGADGVKRADVSYDDRTASVAFRAQTITESEIVALIEKAGFTAEKG